MSQKPENEYWLDLLRVIAAFAVVVLHVAAEPVVFVRDRSSMIWHAGNAFDSMTRWCIGIFIMVSGALLLDPKKRETIAEFYSKRVRRILVPILFWSAAYIALNSWTGQSVTWQGSLRLIWEGRPGYHMWYLFMIIGLYAVTPLLRIYISRVGANMRWGVVFLALAAASGWDFYLSAHGRPLPATIPTMFAPYLGYYLLGFELYRLAPLRTHGGVLFVGFVGSVAVTIFGTHALFEANGPTRLGLYLYEYLSPNVILMSVAVFGLASKLEGMEVRANGITAALQRGIILTGPLTLGIYLWHPMMIMAMRNAGVTAVGSQSVLGVLWVAVPSFIASFILTWLMSRVPILRQTVGIR